MGDQVLMLCPACARTAYHVVSARCPICGGTGTLRLGRPALSLYDPETVSSTVRLVLERHARSITETTTLSAPRQSLLARAVRGLVVAGVLYSDTPIPKPRPLPAGHTAHTLAEDLTGKQLSLFDVNVSDPGQPAFEYAEEDRPRARGLPVLSAAGHPSALALICDPADPLGSTREDVRGRRRRLHDAQVLNRAHQEVAEKRQKGGR